MNTPKWSADMRLGLACVDAGHEAVLAQLRRLDSVSDDQFAAAFLRMVAQLEMEFQEEEAIMEEIAFSGLREHREQHARVLAAMHQTSCRVLQGDLARGRKAAELLGQWFIAHLATHDTLLALSVELQTECAGAHEPRLQ